MQHIKNHHHSSFRRRPGSSRWIGWTPASAGVAVVGLAISLEGSVG